MTRSRINTSGSGTANDSRLLHYLCGAIVPEDYPLCPELSARGSEVSGRRGQRGGQLASIGPVSGKGTL